jgi:hypothetical protein
MTEEQVAVRQRRRIEANAGISRSAHASPDAEPGTEREFLCECGAVDCDERVPLLLFLYEELRAAGEFVLAAGHVLQSVEQAR